MNEEIDLSSFALKLPLANDRALVKKVAAYVDRAIDHDESDRRIRRASQIMADRMMARAVSFPAIEDELYAFWTSVRHSLQVYQLEDIRNPKA